MFSLLKKIWFFYIDGFRSMTIGRTLWLIILIKLVIMFLILKIFFFPNFMKVNFHTDKEREHYMQQELNLK